MDKFGDSKYDLFSKKVVQKIFGFWFCVGRAVCTVEDILIGNMLIVEIGKYDVFWEMELGVGGYHPRRRGLLRMSLNNEKPGAKKR